MCLTLVPAEGRATKSLRGLSVTVLLAGLGQPVLKVRGAKLSRYFPGMANIT